MRQKDQGNSTRNDATTYYNLKKDDWAIHNDEGYHKRRYPDDGTDDTKTYSDFGFQYSLS